MVVHPSSTKIYLFFDALASYLLWMTVDTENKLNDQTLATFVKVGVLALAIL